MAKMRNNEFILLNTHAVSTKFLLLPIIAIITYYYVFETKQLADV